MQTALSLFALLTADLGDRLVPIQATKATLVDVSHALEDMVITERLPAMILTGFQESRHWREETERYRDLAGVAHQICIFAGGELPKEEDQRQIHVRLLDPDPLRQEWFLLVLTRQIGAILCGRDQQTPVQSEGDRRFATLWTFEPPIIARTLELLRTVVARERPDRLADLDEAIRRFPPPPPDARLVTLFTTRLIDDLTQQHQIRLQIERTLAYESRLRALGQVLSGVAHELNNPLQSILGFASLIMEDESLALETIADARHIVDAAERARQIVRSLLQLARPGSPGPTPTDLAVLVKHTLIFVQTDLDNYGIQVTLEVKPARVILQVDAVRLQQLLINLLTNAIHALTPQRAPRQIGITINGEDPAWVDLIVADNGPGIPAHLHERIFEPFFTTKPVSEGTGLGLSIVRTIVQEHEGLINLESSPGQGTIICVRFPVTVQANQAQLEAELSVGRGNILVIDDDPQVNALITRVLSNAGYSVHSETNPIAARDRLASHTYHTVICDLLMPGLSGIEIYEELTRVNPSLARRLIFVTGDATRSSTRAFLEGTGLSYLLKPFSSKQLLAVLSSLDEPPVSASRCGL